MTDPRAAIDDFTTRVLALLHKIRGDERLTRMSAGIADQLKAGINDNTIDTSEMINLYKAGRRVVKIAGDIRAIHAGYQASYGIVNEDGNVSPLFIPAMLFPDEHGHPMLLFDAFVGVCPGFPSSVAQLDSERTHLRCEFWGSDSGSHLGVFLEFFYAVARYFGYNVHGPSHFGFYAIYNDDCPVPKTLLARPV
ncbi:hypothetical protein PoHVEF18_009083 [Penicillium ochrochloron]